MNAILLGIEDQIGTIVMVLAYLGYAVWEAARKKRAQQGQLTGEQLAAQVGELTAQAESVGQNMALDPAFRSSVGIVWSEVLIPKLRALQGWASGLGADADLTTLHNIERRAGMLTNLMQSLLRHAQREDGWVGMVLYVSLDELRQEVQSRFSAYPNLDVLGAHELTRGVMQHVYAAWAPTLFGDVATAALDPASAREALRSLEQMPSSHIGRPGEPPDHLRGLVLAQVLGEHFRVPIPDGAYVLTTPMGRGIRLPANVLIEDIEPIVKRLAQGHLAALGGRSLAQLAGKPLAERAPLVKVPAPRPAPVRAPAPPRAEPAERPSARVEPSAEPRTARAAATAREAKQAPTLAAPRVAVTRAIRVVAPRPGRAAAAPREARAARKARHHEADAAAPRSGKRHRRGRRPSRSEVRDAVILSEILPL